MKYYKNIFKSIKAELICYFCLLTIAPLLFVCIAEYYRNKSAIEQRVIDQLTSIADLKKIELQNWLQERLTDTIVISRYNLLDADATSILQKRRRFETVNQLRNSETAQTGYQRLLNNLQLLKDIYKYYDTISIMDASNGEIVISTNPNFAGKTLTSFEKYMERVEQNKVTVMDIHTSELTNENCMTFFSPIFMTSPITYESASVIIAFLLLDVSVKSSIEPLIQNWQGMGETGETLLVRRKEDAIVYLNNLRHRQNSALNFSLPVSSGFDAPSIASSGGEEGIQESRDYRNVRVLSAYRHIPILNWGLVAKQDVTEAFASVEKLKTRLLLFIVISVVVVIFLIISLTNRITKPILRLSRGAKAIASGNLDQRIEIDSHNEVGLLAQDFNHMAEKLKESHSNLEHKVEERTAQLLRAERLAAVGELAAEVAHEINNPLGGLQNFASMLESEPEKISQTKKYATLILEGLKRVEIIVKRLLIFSRPHALQLAKNDINTLIHNSLDFLEYKIDTDKVHIEKKLSTSLPPVIVDSDQISQVLMNGITNALESMQNGGTLTITTDICMKHKNCVSVSIQDTGCGLSDEIKEKIFEPFFTTKNKDNEKGLGMGLAISKRVIEDHNGEIHIESSEGEGTTLSLCLPGSR